MALQKLVKVGGTLYLRIGYNWAATHGVSKGSALNVRELKNGDLVLEVPKGD